MTLLRKKKKTLTRTIHHWIASSFAWVCAWASFSSRELDSERSDYVDQNGEGEDHQKNEGRVSFSKPRLQRGQRVDSEWTTRLGVFTSSATTMSVSHEEYLNITSKFSPSVDVFVILCVVFSLAYT